MPRTQAPKALYRAAFAAFCVLSFLLAGLLVGLPAGPLSVEAMAAPVEFARLAESSKVADPLELWDALSERGSAKVIVGLKEPGPDAGAADLASPSARSRRAMRVAQARRSFFDRTGWGANPHLRRSFTYQPGFAADVNPEELEELLASGDVEYVEPDRILKADLRQGLAVMSADESRSSYGGAGVAVAVCDTGVDFSHPALGGGGFPNSKVIGGYDFGDNDPTPMDTEGHGTAVAAIVAGLKKTAGDYVGGVAPEAKLYALKITSGDGDEATSSDIIAAWEWALAHQYDDSDNPIRVLNMSFTGTDFSGSCDSASRSLSTTSKKLVDAGISIFVSSGNSGNCEKIGWPACMENVISVGAVYDDDLGNVGWCVGSASCASGVSPNSGCSSGWAVFELALAGQPCAYSNTSTQLDLLAPSNEATTANPSSLGGGYMDGFGGTSAAAPYAAGAAAVVQSAAKQTLGSFLEPRQVRRLLRDTGRATVDARTLRTDRLVNLDRAADLLPGVLATGWWWDASRPGTGLAVEVQGDKLFLGWYVYTATGEPNWYVALLERTGSGVYTGALKSATGWPLGQNYTGFSDQTVGSVTLTLMGQDLARFAWTMGGASGESTFTRFMDDLVGGAHDPRDVTGWWWNPELAGMGLFMEAQDDTIYVAWYHFGDDSQPRWWGLGGGIDMGGFPNFSTTYAGTLMEFHNGEIPGGTYALPSSTGTTQATITFNTDRSASLAWNGKTFPLQRFEFGEF